MTRPANPDDLLGRILGYAGVRADDRLAADVLALHELLSAGAPLPTAWAGPLAEPGQPIELGRGELDALRRSRAWVRVTNPDTGHSVVGRIMGLSDAPTMLLQQPGGLREALPQRYLVEEVPAEGGVIEVSRERLRGALRHIGASAREADAIMDILAGEEGDPP